MNPVCIHCGDSYQFTRVYKGNYCPDCHALWSSTPRRGEASSGPLRTARPAAVLDADDPDDAVAGGDAPYDVE